MKRIALISTLALLPIVSAVGAYYESRVTPYVVAAVVIAVTVLAVLGNVKGCQFFILYSLSLSLLWGTSMIGSHVIGNDIHSEMYVANRAIENGWDIAYRNGGNTSLVVAGIAPVLDRIGFDVVWQFKALYPALFAFVPPILFIAYRKITGDGVAMIAALVVMVMPMFVLDMTGHVKGMVSQLFLVCAIALIFRSDVRARYRYPGIVLSVIGAIVNHYSVAAMTVIMLVGSCGVGVVFWLCNWYRSKRKIKLKFTPPAKTLSVALATSVVMLLLWYSLAGGGAMLSTLLRTGSNFVVNISGVEKTESLQRQYDNRTQPVEVTGTYLDKQEQLIRTAIGLDFMSVDVYGKTFRMLQFVTQVVIIVGVFMLWRKYYNKEPVYTAMLVAVSVIIAMIILVPYLATVMSATRFYQYALFVASPAMVAGLMFLLRKRWIVAVFLSLYIVFTLGVVFEATNQDDITMVNIPYSLAMSNQRMNINGVFGANDLSAREWLLERYKENKQTMIRSDYNGKQFLSEVIGENVVSGELPSSGYYLYVTEWSSLNNTMILGKAPGLRYYYDLDEWIPEQAQLVAQYGSALIYRID